MSFLIECLLIILVLILLVLSTLVIYARWNYGTLESMGIPVVKPHWFLGSNYNYMELVHHWEDVKRAKKLGPIYGVYNGRNPEVYVADPEIVRMVFLQDSDHFGDKRQPDFGHPIENEIMEALNGEKWKVVRGAISPVFTSGKLKQLSTVVERLSKDYVGALVKDAKDNGGRLKINFKVFMRAFAVEVIGECFCGIKLENARDPNNTFVTNMRVALMEDLSFDWTFNLTQVFPFLIKFFPGFPPDGLKFLEDALLNIMDSQEKNKADMPDAIQRLVDLRQKCKTPEFKRLGITENTVYGQAFNLFVGSFHGLTTTFADLSYHLATNPDVNKKVMEEVDLTLKNSKGEISYEAVSKMNYLAACVSETQRKTPAFFRPDRVCTKDWNYEGYHIKKGTEVFIPIYPVHHNPDIYPEPEKFIPDRFLPENKDKLAPCSFIAFGQGHRQCLGMRFTYELFKIFFLNLFKEFRIEKRADTIWKEHPGNHFLVTKDPIYVDLVKR